MSYNEYRLYNPDITSESLYMLKGSREPCNEQASGLFRQRKSGPPDLRQVIEYCSYLCSSYSLRWRGGTGGPVLTVWVTESDRVR